METVEDIQVENRFSNFDILVYQTSESRPQHEAQCMLQSSISILRPVAESMIYRGSAVESQEQPQKQKSHIKGIKNFSATMGMNNGAQRNASNPRLSESSSQSQRLNQFNVPAKRETFSSPHTSRRLKGQAPILIQSPEHFTHGSAHPIIVRRGHVECGLDIPPQRANPNPAAFRDSHPIIGNPRNLQQGENFDRDITHIMHQVDGIEQDFALDILNQHFTNRKQKLEASLKRKLKEDESQNPSSPKLVTITPQSQAKLQRFVISRKSQQRRNIQLLSDTNTKVSLQTLPTNYRTQVLSKEVRIEPEQLINDVDIKTPSAEKISFPVNLSDTFSPDKVDQQDVPLFTARSDCLHPTSSTQISSNPVKDFENTFRPGGMKATPSKRIVMQINRHVPSHLTYIPMKKYTLNQFQAEYDQYAEIQHYLIEFDGQLIDLFNSRKERYLHYRQCATRQSSRLEFSPEEEDDLAYRFQLEDIQKLRSLFRESLITQTRLKDDIEGKLTEERSFFLAQNTKDQATIAQLNQKIVNLKFEMTQIDSNLTDLLIQQQVQSLCNTALVKYQTQLQGFEESIPMRSPVLQELSVLKDKKEKYKRLYQEARTHAECEDRVAQSMIESLENKVSETIVEMSRIKDRWEESTGLLKELQADNKRLEKIVEEQSRSLTEAQMNQMALLSFPQEKLTVPLQTYQSLQVRCDHLETWIESLNLKLILKQADYSALLSHFSDLKNTVYHLSESFYQQLSGFESKVSASLAKFSGKIEKNQASFEEACLYNGNKMHYLEVVEGLRDEKKRVEERCRVLEMRLRCKV